MPSIGQELLNVPMGDMIRQMAFAIAEAQVKLDQSSIEVAEMMGGLRVVYDEEGKVAFDDSRVFFGYEYMTQAEAENHLRFDAALSGNDPMSTINAIKAAQPIDSGAAEFRVPVRLSMLELGFTPTFYQFIDTIIEVKIAIKITRSSEYKRSRSDTGRTTSERSSTPGPIAGIFARRRNTAKSETVTTSQVDASYSSKYSYSAEGASLLRTKLTPIPPPAVLEDRIRRMMEIEEARRLAKIAPAPSPLPPPPTPGT
jgi:hypothetical protein